MKDTSKTDKHNTTIRFPSDQMRKFHELISKGKLPFNQSLNDAVVVAFGEWLGKMDKK